MSTKRVLVIDKLVMQIDDSFQTQDPNKITIDEALEYLLQKRALAKSVLNNNYGNYVYFNAVMPKGSIPDKPQTFTKEILMSFLAQNPDLDYAGLMCTLVYDEELGGYRNIYNEEEEEEFQKRKEAYLMRQAMSMAESDDEIPVDKDGAVKMEKTEESTDENEAMMPCTRCDNICDENCPMDQQE